MKYSLVTVFVIFFSGCLDLGKSEDILIGKQLIKDGSVIELYAGGGGATAPDVVWVKRNPSNKGEYIGKIKWGLFEAESKIWQISDSIIKIRFTDTSIFKGKFRDYTINIYNKVRPHDGSLYADSTY